MALVSASSAETLEPKPEKSDAASQDSRSLVAPAVDSSSSVSAISSLDKPNTLNPDSNLNTNPIPVSNPIPAALTPPAPPTVPSFTLSFRPLGVPSIMQYSTVHNPSLQNPGYQNSSIQPPGVSTPPVSVNPMVSGSIYPAPGQALLPYGQASNGYLSVPAPAPQAALPPGVPRYPGPYPAMVRPGYPLHPVPPAGVIPQIPRLPIPGVRPISNMVTPIVRPVVSILPPAEKPQTTVYVGKIAQTVDNDFLLALLRICGPVKSWKRPQDPSDGKLKEFGFCEFEAAEGVLRALRLLSKLNIDGQELMLNINQATKEYLVRYVEKKTEREKEKQKEVEGSVNEENEGPPSEEQVLPKLGGTEETQNDRSDAVDKGKEDIQKFGIVTDEDCEADKCALEKITNMREERLKTNPLPPPPPIHATTKGSARSKSEVPSKCKDGDSDVDIMKSDAVEEKNDEETNSDNKPAEIDKHELSSPDKRRHDRRSREKDRERDLKREKERELERYERERERERVRRERDRELKIREAERLYKDRMKDWEAREREKEYQRQYEKDREKDRQRERRKEILRVEDGSDDDDDDDDSRKRRRRNGMLEERRRKRQREKDEDMTDRLKEDEEIAEAKRREIEEQREKDLKPVPCEVTKENEKLLINEDEMIVESGESAQEQAQGAISDTISNSGHGIHRSNSSEMNMGSAAVLEMKPNDGPVRKLGFGLIGSGKRTTVPSVFHQEDDEDIDEKKMRPLVPIDYSTEELQAAKGNSSAGTANIVAAAEFAKRISTNPKEEKIEIERERNGRSNDRVGRRDRDRNDYDGVHSRSEIKEKASDKTSDDKLKTEYKKLLDAKQLIDMIPKTKEELFAYEINWAIYDKHALHERMRPWISKKITEFLGEEEATLVDYIVSSTKEHVRASKMLELLQSILDDEAEMFVLKMWRMLIFEIKKVETGLSVKSKA